MKKDPKIYRGFILVFIICLILIVSISSVVKLFRGQHMAILEILPSTKELLPNDSLLFKPNSIGKIKVLTTLMSKNANPLSIATVEDKFCLLIYRLDLADGFSLKNAIKVSDLDTTPTNSVVYRIYEIGGGADIYYSQVNRKSASNIFLTVSGGSIKNSIQKDSIEGYQIFCRSVYLRFSSKDSIDLYLTSRPKLGNEEKLSADILFWEKEKSLYLLIMFSLDSDKPIGDDEIFKMLNFN